MDSIRFIDANGLSDETINKLINVADYGVNTSSGEGFGLMALEMSYLGKPQVALDIGAYRSWLNDDNSVLLKPTQRIHMNYNDGGGAFSETTTPEAFAVGLRLVQTKRSPIVDFTWDDVVKETFDIIKSLPTSDMYV
jgi:glycosyltransferase involved in cell wall biosynthesis